MTKRATSDRKSGDKKKRPVDSSTKFEKLLQKASRGVSYTLRLYVTGTTARSTQAISAIRKLCEEYLKGRYDLKVIDIYQQPGQASDAQIIAAPTLVKEFPLPPRRLIGNLSNREKVIVGLNLKVDKLDENVIWSTV